MPTSPDLQRRAFLASLPFALTAQTSSSKTTAERLGHSPDVKLLMVHADDVGMCHSVNMASTEALLAGAVQSASIMMPCPWVSEIAETARANPNLDLGLHLTLTSEWKHYRWRSVAPPAAVKGLLDPDGYLYRDVRSVAMHATPAEVETELRAQVDRARHFGIQFTHVDTHMGTLYARPDYFEVYTKVARDAGVPCMIPRPTPEAAAEMKEYPITVETLQSKERSGYVLLDRLTTGVTGRTLPERRESYVKFLRELKPGVTKLIVHLAKDDPEIRAVTNSWQQRWADFQFWTSPEARTLRTELGIHPITYRNQVNSTALHNKLEPFADIRSGRLSWQHQCDADAKDDRGGLHCRRSGFRPAVGVPRRRDLPVAVASLAHGLIEVNLSHCLIQRLQGTPCRVIGTMRVRINAAQYVQPDLLVYCGEPILTNEPDPSLTNPKVVLEIRSPSTADYDYGGKFELHRMLPSFEEYVLIAQDRLRVEVFHRWQDNKWVLSTYEGEQSTITLESLDIQLPLTEIYANLPPA